MKVKGIEIMPAQLEAVKAKLAGSSFTLRDFADKLASRSIPKDVAYEAAKRHLQELRRAKTAQFDRQSGTWKLASGAGSLLQHATILQTQASQPLLLPDARLPQSHQQAVSDPAAENKFFGGLRRGILGLVMLITCLTSIGALVFINATFALEFAETPIFQLALVGAFMACDLLRPLLVARGIFDIGRRAMFRGILGILVAVSLAPLSVLSSTTVLSATMQLGVQTNERALALAESREVLRTQYDLILVEIDRAWRAHRSECNRGGCGPKALEIANQAHIAEDKATALMNELLAKTEDIPETSSFVSRTVQAFEELGLFSQERLILLPLLIALTLELAALFGPALLLARRA